MPSSTSAVDPFKSSALALLRDPHVPSSASLSIVRMMVRNGMLDLGGAWDEEGHGMAVSFLRPPYGSQVGKADRAIASFLKESDPSGFSSDQFVLDVLSRLDGSGLSRFDDGFVAEVVRVAGADRLRFWHSNLTHFGNAGSTRSRRQPHQAIYRVLASRSGGESLSALYSLGVDPNMVALDWQGEVSPDEFPPDLLPTGGARRRVVSIDGECWHIDRPMACWIQSDSGVNAFLSAGGRFDAGLDLDVPLWDVLRNPLNDRRSGAGNEKLRVLSREWIQSRDPSAILEAESRDYWIRLQSEIGCYKTVADIRNAITGHPSWENMVDARGRSPFHYIAAIHPRAVEQFSAKKYQERFCDLDGSGNSIWVYVLSLDKISEASLKVLRNVPASPNHAGMGPLSALLLGDVPGMFRGRADGSGPARDPASLLLASIDGSIFPTVPDLLACPDAALPGLCAALVSPPGGSTAGQFLPALSKVEVAHVEDLSRHLSVLSPGTPRFLACLLLCAAGHPINPAHSGLFDPSQFPASVGSDAAKLLAGWLVRESESKEFPDAAIEACSAMVAALRSFAVALDVASAAPSISEGKGSSLFKSPAGSGRAPGLRVSRSG